MTLSFLYLAFVRVLQLLRRFGRDYEELAIEVVMLRHEVVVLRRQVARPALRPSDRALLAIPVGRTAAHPVTGSGDPAWVSPAFSHP